MRSIAFIAGNSVARDLCVDVGCGTGFVTSFEVKLYRNVVAIDISSRMIEVARKRLGGFDSLNLLVCDAELLPLKNEIANLVSISSVLHHLPRPFNSMNEISRVLKIGGFVYVTREPNFRRFRRFFDFFDRIIVQKVAMLVQRLLDFKSRIPEHNIIVEGLDYAKVDIHYSKGIFIEELTGFLRSMLFDVVSAYSYHWIYPDSDAGTLQKLLTRSNFVIEKIPLSNKLGRYVSIVAQKLEGRHGLY
jgi:SAM-dependent methyltransferase